jgi:catechol 2,3-dioxygenase-like lactoylglutathione lyase family enzyme
VAPCLAQGIANPQPTREGASAASDEDKARLFYEDILGLKVLMDVGWIRTSGSTSKMTIQFSVMSEGGSGTAVPDMSIEVDDVEEALTRVQRAKYPYRIRPSDGALGSTQVK